MKKGKLIFGILFVLVGIGGIIGVGESQNTLYGILFLAVGGILLYLHFKAKAAVRPAKDDAEKPIGPDYYRPVFMNGVMNATPLIHVEELPDSFVVIDVETTGLEPERDRIVEVAIVTYERENVIESYSTLIDPETRMPEAASAVNGITDGMLVGKPKIHEVIPEIYRRIAGKVLVGYNVLFDIKFIGAFLRRHDITIQNVEFIDVLDIVRSVLKSEKLENKKLETVKRFFGMDNPSHRALNDCQATVAVFSRCLTMQKIHQLDEQIKKREALAALNDAEKDFIETVKKELAGINRLDETEIDIMANKMINFRIANIQIGRIKLRGKTMGMQIFRGENLDWIEIADLEEAKANIANWLEYIDWLKKKNSL